MYTKKDLQIYKNYSPRRAQDTAVTHNIDTRKATQCMCMRHAGAANSNLNMLQLSI